MVDPKSAYMLIDQNLTVSQRVRLQHLMGSALQPILGLATGHYRIDLSNDFDRLTVKKIIENSTRTAFLRRKEGMKDTSQHANFHGMRNEVFNGKSFRLDPTFLDSMPKFGTLEFDYVQIGRQPARAISEKRFTQLLQALQLEQMKPAMGSRAVNALAATTEETPSSPPRRGSVMGSSAYRATPSSASGREDTGAGKRPATKAKSTKKISPYPPLVPHTRELFAELDRIKSNRNYLKFR
ncbi:hypothetical protein PINS_up005283 [Pythium insidiosum]|nr:hypothetical protein PINS_up005283 [Pythium insidiosum]